MEYNFNDLLVRPCSLGDVRKFVETHHYSHSVHGITPFLCFQVLDRRVDLTDWRVNETALVGAAIFGAPGQVQTEAKYAIFPLNKDGDRSDKGCIPKHSLVELRRLVLLPDLPKNSETKILSLIIQRLKTLGVDRIISYADPNQKREDHPDGCHTGLIYKAFGFHKVHEAGNTKALIVLKDFTVDGKTYKVGRRLPIRNIDQYQNFRVPDAGTHDEQLDVITSREGFEWRKDWESAVRKEKAVYWRDRVGGKMVYVIKTKKYLSPYAKGIRDAEAEGLVVRKPELGKILWIKDLKSGMVYFETPQHEEKTNAEKASRAIESGDGRAKHASIGDEFADWFS
jgi:hypothetical protein